ncbi:MAG: DUF6064 family protein [Acidobacteriota bacterium]
MSEWWTYTLSDFLLFSPRTYFRLFEIYNAAVWPAQIVSLCLGLVILALLLRPGAPGARSILTILTILTILSALWLFVAVAFLAHRYTTINWAAVYFAWAFGVQAALLLWSGARSRGSFDAPADPASRAGVALFAFALLVLPAIGPLLGRGWKGVGLFGVTPDPTAVGTLGILLLARVRHRWFLMAIPAVWGAISGATLLAMKAPDFWIPPFASAAAVSIAFAQTLTRRR